MTDTQLSRLKRIPGFRPARGGEQAWSWHLGFRDRGVEGAEKSPCHTQASRGPARPPVRGFLAGPLQGQLGSDRMTVLSGLHRRYELRKEDFLGTHLEAEGFAQTQGGHQLGL